MPRLLVCASAANLGVLSCGKDLQRGGGAAEQTLQRLQHGEFRSEVAGREAAQGPAHFPGGLPAAPASHRRCLCRIGQTAGYPCPVDSAALPSPSVSLPRLFLLLHSTSRHHLTTHRHPTISLCAFARGRRGLGRAGATECTIENCGPRTGRFNRSRDPF